VSDNAAVGGQRRLVADRLQLQRGRRQPAPGHSLVGRRPAAGRDLLHRRVSTAPRTNVERRRRRDVLTVSDERRPVFFVMSCLRGGSLRTPAILFSLYFIAKGCLSERRRN